MRRFFEAVMSHWLVLIMAFLTGAVMDLIVQICLPEISRLKLWLGLFGISLTISAIQSIRYRIAIERAAAKMFSPVEGERQSR